jgi:hypothetical protein
MEFLILPIIVLINYRGNHCFLTNAEEMMSQGLDLGIGALLEIIQHIMLYILDHGPYIMVQFKKSTLLVLFSLTTI